MKYRNNPWTADEEAILARAAEEKVSPARLSVRLKRSEGSIKRKMRELGLAGTKRGPRRAVLSEIQFVIDPLVQTQLWLEACRLGDLRSAMHFYLPEATLECSCSGAAVYAGSAAIQEYWAPKLRSMHPLRFTLEAARVQDGGIFVDYLSYEGRPVRMHLTFNEEGRILRSECAPRTCDRLAA
jgi:hypothetical protein